VNTSSIQHETYAICSIFAYDLHQKTQCPTLVTLLMPETDPYIRTNFDRSHEASMLHIFGELMTDHAGGPANLAILDHDPETYPEQRLDVVGVERELANIETIRSLGNLACSGFDSIVDGFSQRKDLLNHICQELRLGRNILTVYDHSNIINIALGGAALHLALMHYKEDKSDLADLHEIGHQLIISKGVTRLAAFGSIPTTEVLRNVWDTYFSIPPSKKVRESAIPDDVRKSYNTAMLEHFHSRATGSSGTIQTIAGSGSTDKLVVSGKIKKRPTVHMGPLAQGTIQLMKESLILPIGLIIDGDSAQSPHLSIGRLRAPIQHDADAHGIMAEIANMNQQTSGLPYIYHPTREDFEHALVQKR
jgi:hypothetical protein